jgi:predicted PurR-regulated permease PerM
MTKTVVVIGIILVLVAVGVLLRDILRPLILAGILAYLLSPLSQQVEQRLRLRRGWATGSLPAAVVRPDRDRSHSGSGHRRSARQSQPRRQTI